MIYTSSKRIELGSTAFRQPNADSHCKFVHGYQLNAEITFGCKELDNNNWVYDFGGLKELKSIFNNQFDHTLVIAGNDVHRDKFIALGEVGAADVRIMEGGVGIEKFAEWVYKTADTYVDESTDGRVWVENVTVFEHSNNYASVSRPVKEGTLYKDEEGKTTYVSHEEFERTWKEWSEKGRIPTTEDTQQDQPEVKEEESQSAPNPKAARVGSNKREGNFSDPFAGTTWGNS
jgi:6-pyruvoyltetrahydropterin/6-carboxytetrahydropterin synthase